MKDEERLWILMARKLTGEATDEDLLELQNLLQELPDASYTAKVLTQEGTRPPEELTAAENAFLRHHQRMALRQAIKEANYFAHHFKPHPGRKEVKIRERWKNKTDLIQNQFKSSLRNLARNKSFSLINISGLAIAMASAIVILLWIQLQLSYDQFHKNKDRIYQLYTLIDQGGKIGLRNSTPMVMAAEIKKNHPQVEEVVRLNWVGAFTLGDGHLQTQGYITDSGFFKIFSFPLALGDPNSALRSRHSIVLTESLAKKLFGKTNILGKRIRVDSNANFTVTGVLKDLPSNTQFRSLEYLIPWSYMKEVGWENSSWAADQVRTYVLLQPGVSESAGNALLGPVLQSRSQRVRSEILLHPMRKWWLYTGFTNGKMEGGQIETVRLFGMIAAFILLIACINYMNLSTARSQRRAREVGIRKVIGASTTSLIRQFIGESILISFLAGLLALLILQPGLEGFNWITQQKMEVPYSSWSFWGMTIGFILLTGIIAGSYPAFYLSAFRPAGVLKGNTKSGHARITPRKVLVIFQFTFAILLITCTTVIYRQLAYSRDRDLGYKRDNLLFVYNKGNIQRNYPLVKQALLNSGAIVSITRTNSPITDVWSRDDDFEWKTKGPQTRYIFNLFISDNCFTQTMGLTLVAGRDINIDKTPADTSAALVNLSAAQLMESRYPLGDTITSHGKQWHIVGVVNDFIAGNPYSSLEPVIIVGRSKDWGTVNLRLNDKNSLASNLRKIEKVFKTYNPEYAFDYRIVEDVHGEIFQEETHIGVLATVFSGLTIFISCLGLFALAAYMAENRIKEIGIRKVLGASVSGIATLLSKDFLKLVFISFIIASPLSGWFMHEWLQNFPYHIRISWWIFGLTGLLTVLITLITVSSQAIGAALMNPADSLRTE